MNHNESSFPILLPINLNLTHPHDVCLLSPPPFLLLDHVHVVLEHNGDKVAATTANVDSDVPHAQLPVCYNRTIMTHCKTIGDPELRKVLIRKFK